MAFGMCFCSSSVIYFGKAHLGRTFEGPEIVKKKRVAYNVHILKKHDRASVIYLDHQDLG